jgi:transposase
MRHSDHLKKTRAQQSVYAQSSDAAVVMASIREVIATLDERIAEIERKIRQHFDDHPDLKRRRDLLMSIPEIGETTVGAILSEIPHLDRFESAKAVAVFAGLSPRERQSGTSIHGRPRMCETGNARIRKARTCRRWWLFGAIRLSGFSPSDFPRSESTSDSSSHRNS